jgi:hypothetical protein
MTVFELYGTEVSYDWATRGKTVRIGLYSSMEKVEQKIAEIRQSEDWHMDWVDFTSSEVEVE